MKFIHISDLHIGKRLNEYSLIEDQQYILNEVINIIKIHEVDAVLIAGDIYDKSVPSAEAVSLLDSFLALLSETGVKTYIINGNHDSAERIAYGESAFKKQGIFISPVFDGNISKHEYIDQYGKVNIYLLPFIKPLMVKRYFENENIETYTDAIQAVIKNCNINKEERNIILAHQFVTGAERTESEEVNVGGLDNVEGWVFDDFDYVALGHIHKNQKIKREEMRYSGTLLKYSASEANDEKCVILCDMKEKGVCEITHVSVTPLRDYIDIKGRIEEILKSENKKDFVRITLTNEEPVTDAYGKLKINYPFMTELVFDRKRKTEESNRSFSKEKSYTEQFSDFYSLVNGTSLTKAQADTVEKLFECIKEDKE